MCPIFHSLSLVKIANVVKTKTRSMHSTLPHHHSGQTQSKERILVWLCILDLIFFGDLWSCRHRAKIMWPFWVAHLGCSSTPNKMIILRYHEVFFRLAAPTAMPAHLGAYSLEKTSWYCNIIILLGVEEHPNYWLPQMLKSNVLNKLMYLFIFLLKSL